MPGPGNVGERVRNLRLTRRLSQAQLAGHDLSDSYISLIESGKRTPTPAVLRLLAERLGCTPEYLTDGVEPQQRAHLEVRERHAELALLGGDAGTALAEFDEVIERSDDPDLSVRADWGRARALEAMGRVEDAIRCFEDLREQAERDPGRASRLPPIIALARCYHLVGDLGQAIALGERALSHLHRLGITTGQEYAELGRVLLLAYVDRSDHRRAHDLGRRLLGTPETGSTSASTAYQAASSRALSEGSVGDALHFADRAIAVHGEDDLRHTRARLQVAGARALLRGVGPYRSPGDKAFIEPGLDTSTGVSSAATGAGAVGGSADGSGEGAGSDGAEAPFDGSAGTSAQAAEEALDLLRRSAPVLTGPEAIECSIETARALIALGGFDEAIAIAEDITRSADARSGDGSVSDIEVVQACLIIAKARLGQGDEADARSLLSAMSDRLDRMGPSRAAAQVFRELGDLCDLAGDFSAATAAYRRALAAAGLRPTTRSAPGRPESTAEAESHPDTGSATGAADTTSAPAARDLADR